MANSSPAPLAIREADVCRAIEEYIRDLVEKRGASGILLGLSGGLDSAVLATLAVRALGKERVHAAFLYERDSDRSSEKKARLVADRLRIDLSVEDIEPVMRERGIYNAPAMRRNAFSSHANRASIRLYSLLTGERPFMSGLRRGDFGRNRVKEFLYRRTVLDIENAFDARHRYRRELLEARARDRNWLLLSAANRSECMLGWFVKSGIDDLPLSPIMALYKTQVVQLAAYLGVPDEIIRQVASPDMMKGITDEFSMGVLYARADLVLDGFDRGLTEKEILATGVTRRDLDSVRTLHLLSVWKRESPHETPPVDGGARGGWRLDLGPAAWRQG